MSGPESASKTRTYFFFFLIPRCSYQSSLPSLTAARISAACEVCSAPKHSTNVAGASTAFQALGQMLRKDAGRVIPACKGFVSSWGETRKSLLICSLVYSKNMYRVDKTQKPSRPLERTGRDDAEEHSGKGSNLNAMRGTGRAGRDRLGFQTRSQARPCGEMAFDKGWKELKLLARYTLWGKGFAHRTPDDQPPSVGQIPPVAGCK